MPRFVTIFSAMYCYFQARARGANLAVLLLWAAVFSGLVVSPAIAGDAATPRLLGSGPASPVPWVMADFNQDGELDLATVGAPNYDGQLQIQLSASPVPALSHRLLISGNRLNVRDLDGDSDSDILLETPFRELIAVWINDGTGHFHKGSIETF